MAPSSSSSDTPAPAPAPAPPSSTTTSSSSSARPLSESLLNEKWDRALSSALIKSSLGAGFGIVFSVLLFRRRAWPVWTGLGFGAGRAWEEADASFKRGGAPNGRDGLRLVRS